MQLRLDYARIKIQHLHLRTFARDNFSTCLIRYAILCNGAVYRLGLRYAHKIRACKNTLTVLKKKYFGSTQEILYLQVDKQSMLIHIQYWLLPKYYAVVTHTYPHVRAYMHVQAHCTCIYVHSVANSNSSSEGYTENAGKTYAFTVALLLLLSLRVVALS